jgi:hypothetical protein
MVKATGTNTLGFIVWTVVLTIVTWLATVIQQTGTLRSKGTHHPFGTAVSQSLAAGSYSAGAVAIFTLFAWVLSCCFMVYNDHVSLVADNIELRKRLDVSTTSIRIKGMIMNQNQRHEAIAQIWLAVDNIGESTTLRDWALSINTSKGVFPAAHTVGQPALKGGLNIPFLDIEFQRPVGIVADMQGYVTFAVPKLSQAQLADLHLDPDATLTVSATDFRGRTILATRNIEQLWNEWHEVRPNK